MLKKQVNNSKASVGVGILFLVFFVYLFMQHLLVGMYYDDFGNASLSYGYDSSSICGTEYTFGDLMDWAQYIYYNWGGRIVYALILIPLLKDGPHMFMEIQAIVLGIIFLMMYQIVKRYSKQTNGIAVVIMFIIVYGLMRGDILSQGIYWASASVLYVWPMVAFLATILIYGCLEEKIRRGEKLYIKDFCGLLITIPMTTLSQEQVGGALLVWMICNAVLAHWKEEKLYWKLDCFAGIYGFASFGVFFAAPGNWVRLAGSQSDKMPFLEKIFTNLQKVVYLMSHTQLNWFNLVLLIVGILVIISLHKKWCYTVVALVCLGPFLIVDILDILGIRAYTDLVKGVSFGLFLMDMFVLLLIYFGKRKQLEFMAIMIAAVASVVCLIFSPAFALRSLLPYVFFGIILVAIVLANSLQEIRSTVILSGIIVGLFGMSIISAVNMTKIYNGYKSNYEANEYNHRTLKESDASDDCIYLMKYDNNIYRGTMACDEGFEFINYWVKEYYDLPQDITIRWLSKETIEQYESGNIDDIILSFENGFYDDENGARWADKDGEIVLYNNSNRKKKVVLSFKVWTGYEDSANIEVFMDEISVGNIVANNEGNTVEIELMLNEGKNKVVFSTDAKKVENDKDVRNLYMFFADVSCLEIIE